MLKRIFSLLSVIVIVFHVETTNVIAAVKEVEVGNFEDIKDIEEMIEFDHDMPEEIQINLPEPIVWEEEWIDIEIEDALGKGGLKSITTNSISATNSYNMLTSSYEPIGVHTTGVATGTVAIAGMDKANQNSYAISKTDSTQSTYFKFGEKTTSLMAFPGMQATNVCGETCYDMIPQGIEYYGGYFFLTAYCGETKSPVHRAVIYVMDSSKNYVTTLVTTEKNHAGGIAYANGYLWVCSGDKSISYYKYSEIVSKITYAKQNSNVKSTSLTYVTHGELTTNDEASFCTTYNGNLCIGTHNENGDSKIGFYNPIINGTGKLPPTVQITTFPKQLQGAVFQVVNGKVYLMVTASLGRNNPSIVYIYESTSTSLNTLKRKKELFMPPMIEEAAICGSNIFFVFESCGRRYRDGTDDKGKANIVIGNVCAFSRSFIFK